MDSGTFVEKETFQVLSHFVGRTINQRQDPLSGNGLLTKLPLWF